ncbi:MAG TPA: hypothetical protein VNH84_03580 [Candidatus Saccharimonadales bacterium]|nr:hypothetical protein [Candidatus Saccharimonadales bacterium]
MKILKSSSVTGLVLGMFLIAPASLQATVTAPLTVSLTAFVEVGDTIGVIYKSKIVKTRITTKDLLSFLSDETGVTFPDGAYIEVDPEGPVHVKGPEGFDKDVSELVSTHFSFDDGKSVWSGTYNNDTSAEKSSGMFLMSLTVKNAGGDEVASVSGLATEKYNASAPVDGMQKVVAGLTATVVGSGDLDAEGSTTVILSGKLVMKANGYFEAD